MSEILPARHGAGSDRTRRVLARSCRFRHTGSCPAPDYESLGREALLSIPTPDHYLPLLYVIGTRQANDSISFPVEGVDGGSISMLSVRVGEAKK